MSADLVPVTERDRGAASAILMQECTTSAQTALWGGADESVLVQEIARHRISERERCAALCLAVSESIGAQVGSSIHSALAEAATAIREQDHAE